MRYAPSATRAETRSRGVTSAPNRAEWDEALPQLDLLVSMDFYVTETNRHADYILPATTFLERDDYPWFITPHMSPPYAVWTDAVQGAFARDYWALLANQVPATQREMQRLAEVIARARRSVK